MKLIRGVNQEERGRKVEAEHVERKQRREMKLSC